MGGTAIVSWNENGFWQADIFLNTEPHEIEAGLASDGFFTMAREASSEDTEAKARETWPSATVIVWYPDEDDEDGD